MANIRSWKHSGFSVDQSVRLEAGDQEGVQRLIQYFLRCPFSQARMIEVTEAGKVIYKTEHNAVGRFPPPVSEFHNLGMHLIPLTATGCGLLSAARTMCGG